MTLKIQYSTNQRDLDNKFWLKTPVRAVIYLTNSCNYICKHCYASDYSYQELSLKEYKSIFNKLSKKNVLEVVFLGGEPFLRKDFLEIAYLAKEKGLGIKVSTNGSLLNYNNTLKIYDLFDGRIQVSLDSSIQKINDSIRGDGTYNKTIKGINKLLSKGIEFNLGIVINKLNYKELPKMYEFANNKKIKGLHIMRVMPKGRALVNWNKLNLSNEEWIKTVRKIRIIAKEEIPKLQIDGTYEYSNFTEPLGKCMSGCEAGRYELTIMSDGTIVPCDMFNNIEIGNIKKINLKKEWKENKIYNKFRESKNNLEGRCSICDVDFCIGCRYQSLILNKGFYGEDPFCVRKDLIKENG